MVMWFEDFAQGQKFTTASRTVTEADIVAFAAWTGDANPLHTDAEFAANSRFGQRIGHGIYGIAVCQGLMSRTGIFEGSAVALLNVEKWNFQGPLHIGDTVYCSNLITQVRASSRGDAGIVKRQVSLINQRGEAIQSGSMSVLVACRPET